VSYRVEALSDHDLSGFACGKPELDDWLRRHARTTAGQGTRTYVLVDEEGRIAGYFALAPHLLIRDDAPPRLARGAPHQIPAILLAKLALDSTMHGSGLGRDLLVHALATILDAARRAGGRVVLVDAFDDEARAFYERHDFEALTGQPRRLVLKLSTVAKALGVPWP
jgi:GNAT superfamily N-acetyltransferase